MSGATQSTILLIGANGQLGWELRRTLAPLGPIVAPARSQLDLSAPHQIPDLLRSIRPAVVVNAGAYTDVDGAERERDLAFTVNADAPAVLASETARAGSLFVQFSTDYVFDGNAVVAYQEDDAASPLNVYGASKRAGERAIIEAGGEHLILRTAWLYGGRGRNFLRTILRLSREREALAVVDDQIGCPTWARMLAEATAAALAIIKTHPDAHRSGIYHVCAPDHASWFDFAAEIVARDPLRHEHVCRGIRRASTAEVPRPAVRPRFSALDTHRFAATFEITLPPWREQLALALNVNTHGELPRTPVDAVGQQDTIT